MSTLCKSLLVPVRKNWLKQAGRLLASLLLIAFRESASSEQFPGSGAYNRTGADDDHRR